MERGEKEIALQPEGPRAKDSSRVALVTTPTPTRKRKGELEPWRPPLEISISGRLQAGFPPPLRKSPATKLTPGVPPAGVRTRTPDLSSFSDYLAGDASVLPALFL